MPPIDDTPLLAAERMGAPTAVLAQVAARLQAQRQAAIVQVWPEHWHAVTLFLLMGTQWRCIPMPSTRIAWIGLDYAALDQPMAAAAEQVAPAHHQPIGVLMEQLQVLERTAAAVLNE